MFKLTEYNRVSEGSAQFVWIRRITKPQINHRINHQNDDQLHDLLSIYYRCGAATIRWLLPFWRVSRWNRHMVVGGWWWDRPYKGAHVTIKTISLDSVLRLIRRFCVPLYRENHRRGGREKNGSRKSESDS